MAARKKTAKKASKPTAKPSKPEAKSSKARSSARKAVAGPSVRVVREAVVAKEPAKATKTNSASAAPKAETVAQATKSKKATKVAKTETLPLNKTASVVSGPDVKNAVAAPVFAVTAKKAAPESARSIKVVVPTAAPSPTLNPTAPASAPKPVEKVLETKTAVRVNVPANVAAQTVVAKAPKAPMPTKTNVDEQGGEQKTMKNSVNRLGFKLNEFVVYPAHGVGQIVALEEQEVAGFRLELFVINFTKDKMTLRVPTSKVTAVGMRKLSDADQARRALEILTGRARIKRTMWSRRAQEYEAKINSGDINAIAEVVRDLFRSEAQPEQSYSERQLYEAALDRMMREIAAVQKLSDTEALKVIETQLKKNAKRAVKAEATEGDDADVEEAA